MATKCKFPTFSFPTIPLPPLPAIPSLDIPDFTVTITLNCPLD